MKSNIQQFNAVVDRFAMRIPEKAALLQKKVVMEAIRGVVFKTPVLTGRARGGWQTTIGTPAKSQTGRLDPNGEAAIAEALAVLESLPPYDIVYISNNVNYIIYLEEGSSKQAPAGMVALTIEELKGMFS